jgi:transketolase
MEGDHNTHGAPLPSVEINATKKKLGLPIKQFYLPKEVIENFRQRFPDLMYLTSSWKDHWRSQRKNKDLRSILDATIGNRLPELNYPEFESGTELATRKAFGATLDSFAKDLPQLIGGSADLEPSNYTGNFAKTYGDFQKGKNYGRNIAFGVREFPMAAMMNGMALHGGVIPFGGTFLVFSDYERPALRLAAIQAIRVIHEFTHDSFFVGEDGPTHQPIEHAMALRAIPNFNVFRPADAKETVACFDLALQNERTPSALLLTRQGVPIMDIDQEKVSNGVSKGAYTVKEPEGAAELIFLATGSEVSLALDVAELMNDKRIRVVSMPCWELFEQQSEKYRSELIPDQGCLRISMEAGITAGWEKYIGHGGISIGIDHYGASAPGRDLAHEFGFTADQVSKKIQDHLGFLL